MASTSRKRKPPQLVVSLDEFASICGVTPETMRKHLKTAPVDSEWLLERGRRGVGYKIAAEGGLAWWRDRETGGGDDELRLRQLAEFRLRSLGDGAGEDDELLLTGKQRFEEFKAGQAELAYRELIGELCRVAEIEDETVNAVIELRRQLQGVGPAIGHKHQLPREVWDAIDEASGERLKMFVTKLDAEVDFGCAGRGPPAPGRADLADAGCARAAPVRQRAYGDPARVRRGGVPQEDHADAGGGRAPPSA